MKIYLPLVLIGIVMILGLPFGSDAYKLPHMSKGKRIDGPPARWPIKRSVPAIHFKHALRRVKNSAENLDPPISPYR
uniref:Uncharacterized protein n=1 Tax=Pinctada fucata TaxID=50426 RepID=A0A194ANN2_PINFU